MKRYIKIYRQLLRLNFAALLAYRVNFINSVLSSVGWGAFSLYSVVVLTTQITSAYGWSRNEILLFNGIYGVIMGAYHMFISVNMGRLSRIIHFGDLDGILVKPIDSQFSVSLWLVDFTLILRIFIATAFTLWILSLLQISFSLSQIALFVVFAISAWIVLYSLWFLVLTNIIWHTNLSNLVRLLYASESMGRFPKEMSRQLGGFLFFVVLPITLIINTPTRALLNKVVIDDAALLLLFAVVLGFVARKYWLYALRHYASASS